MTISIQEMLPYPINAEKTLCHLSPDTLPADAAGKSALICELRDDENQPVSGLATYFSVSITPGLSMVWFSMFTEDAKNPGTYTASIRTGSMAGVWTIAPLIDNIQLPNVTLTVTA
ncbi:invasin domain 3-containing protein [Enterobacteriaceae bacterium LUAb1]